MKTLLRPFAFRRRAALAAGVLALAGLVAGVQGAPSSPPSTPLTFQRDGKPVARGQLERASFADVVKRVSPSVVKITVQIKARAVRMDGQFPGMDDPMLRQFFGGRTPRMETPSQMGLGSGVIVSADGYIVTNNHVVENATQLTVTLDDGREFSAKVVGRDPLTDLAVIKVDAKNLPAITFADSAKTEVGDRVLAIGNPFGIGETVTSGIISAKGRRVGILNDVKGFENFLQTDAAINPGNSGGALVDIDGRLVGINTAILSRSGGFQGVGLAVPSDLVSQIAASLVNH
ncbi:MAG: trypsin-like peptidase domain-containing protein, partial [Opitutaceae bacterium]